MTDFRVVSEFEPAGDQPQAIDKIVSGFQNGQRYQTLLGVTGSGKTFTMAHTIARLGKPTLIMSHNKTLAAQLFEEFRELFPENAVNFFVSYYDYYQPEAYIPQRDIYIEKDSSRNDDLDRLRLAATSSVISRRDAIVVASVSCIFGLGSPDEYKASVISLRVGTTVDRDELLKKFVRLQYDRSNLELKRGGFRVRGDVIELHPAEEEFGIRIELFGDEIEKIAYINPLSGETIENRSEVFVYPAVHYVMPEERLEKAVADIRAELDERVMQLRHHGKLLEAQRLLARTKYDIEMMLEVGFCSGIENYTRHLNQSEPGSKPYTLVDYFPDDFLLIIDESHASVPQIGAMYNGDRARKTVLVEHGFRLPSCLDNRPMKFEEFESMWKNVLFVSATPGPFELERSGGEIVEQVIRPTGLVDPEIDVLPASGQVPHLLDQIKQRAAAGERVLVTTLTKRLAEDLASYCQQAGMRSQYLHSEVDTLERVEILRELRLGKFDVLIGVNLLREGLDLPEVSLVAILDADKEGFLRSETSLIQMIGRCARNINSRVILYGDKVTDSMQRAMDETNRRREIQLAYNKEHGITPDTVKKAIRDGLLTEVSAMRRVREAVKADEGEYDRDELIAQLEEEMLDAAKELDFEKAAALRDHVKKLKDSPELKVAAAEARPTRGGKRGKSAANDDGEDWKPKSQRRRPAKRRR
ncbi:MAG: excinuclease ABC subunit UvrB [Phycisphaerae bacterium]